MTKTKKRMLTGDRPTGPLHLGHYFGSIVNRIKYQDDYEPFIIIADLHTLTTKSSKDEIKQLDTYINGLMLDYISCGLDPVKCNFYIQSKCQVVYELNLIFQMITTENRLMGLPSVKEMAKNARIDESSMPLGLIGYPVLQAADILMAQAAVVPIGKDNLSHIEITRYIARKCNQMYGDVFQEPEAILSDVPSLIGIDGKGKMSKSAQNAIFLSDDPDTVSKKVMRMYTDPNRVSASTPGTVEDNPLFIYHDLFTTDKSLVDEYKDRYRSGTVGDVEVKRALIDSIQSFLDPIRQKRKQLESDMGYIQGVLEEGTRHAQEVSERTLATLKSAMGMVY
jgi:tryptophanyl-tRNA synthetase